MRVCVQKGILGLKSRNRCGMCGRGGLAFPSPAMYNIEGSNFGQNGATSVLLQALLLGSCTYYLHTSGGGGVKDIEIVQTITPHKLCNRGKDKGGGFESILMTSLCSSSTCLSTLVSALSRMRP